MGGLECLPMTDQYDSPWKDIVGEYFPEFLAFFFPDAHAGIDWQRRWQSCDKELSQVVRDAELGQRFADKLMKVWLPGGEEQYVLVHIEVQGERDAAFAERMFVYNYRVYDAYRRPVVSLAVLADDAARWRPRRFGYGLWGCRMGIEFPSAKLRDYQDRWEDLEAAANPFATVVMAYLKARQTRKSPQDRLHWKTQLVRRLYQRGFSRSEILELFRFIDWVMMLPPELERRFQDQHEQFEAELNMQYVTSVERMGIEKGLAEGLAQGVREGEASLLRRQLRRRFSELPGWVEERLEAASREELEAWSERILDAKRLDEVFGRSDEGSRQAGPLSSPVQKPRKAGR